MNNIRGSPVNKILMMSFVQNIDLKLFQLNKKRINGRRHRKNTQKATESAIAHLQGFPNMKSLKQLSCHRWSTWNPPRFYTTVQPHEKDFMWNTLKCWHAALNRHFHDKKLEIRCVRKNEIFKGVLLEAKKSGYGVKVSTPKITQD